MIMAFGDASAMDGRSPEWIERLIDFMIRIDDELTASGELVFEQGLADPSSATTIGWEDGHRTTTARPYVAPGRLAGRLLGRRRRAGGAGSRHRCAYGRSR